MASRPSLDFDFNQVIIDKNQQILKITLNRPQQLNSLNPEMTSQMKRAFEIYEVDDTVGLLILTGQGKAFSSGGDLLNYHRLMSAGHLSLAVATYRELLLLVHLIATYKKPVVMVMNGLVMGGGAAIAMNANFRIVTENTVFAMPEVFIGSFVDIGVSYFFSRLSGHYGAYLGLTGARISGAAMLASNLATHFVYSKDLKSMENELSKMTYMDESTISNVLEKFTHNPTLKSDGAFARLDMINKCFSKKTVEDILSSLESEVVRSTEEKWMVNAIKSMKSASPTSLKITLKNIREGGQSTREECLMRDYIIFQNIIRGKLIIDLYEGVRAVAIDKDKRPKWNPVRLEEVSDEFVNQFFQDHAQDEDEDEDWDSLEFENHTKITKTKISKL